MGRDRHSKSTEPGDLQHLANGGASAQRSVATVRRPQRDEIRPTCKIHKDELLGLIDRAMRPATDPGNTKQDLEVELQVFDPNQVKKTRSTQRSRAKLFQLLLRAKDAGIAVTPEELEELTDEDAEALVESRRQMAKGSVVTPKVVSPEAALDLLEQGITDEPPVMQQSEQPFAHSMRSEQSVENELAARRRKSPETKPLSEIELAAVASTARKIATGEMEPVGMDTPTALLGHAAFASLGIEPAPIAQSTPDSVETVAAPPPSIDLEEPLPVTPALLDEPRPVSVPMQRWQRPDRRQVTAPPPVKAQRDYWMLAAVTTALVAFAMMLLLLAL